MLRSSLSLLGWSVVLFAGAVAAAPRDEPVSWEIDGRRFEGRLVWDDASDTPRPALLMAPNWMGVNDAAVAHAKEIAGDDYVVLVADVYGADLRPTNRDEALAAVRPIYADRELMRTRANKALEVLREQAGKAPLDGEHVGAIGFCFGGTVALELARSGADIAGVASFHGDLGHAQPAQADTLKASILVLNGAADESVPDEAIAAFEAEMDVANADWQFVDFGGAVHCFSEKSADGRPNCRYHPLAAGRATRMMHAFFDERFGG